MSKKILMVLAIGMLAVAGAGCNNADSTNANLNANAVAMSDTTTTRTAPDGSVITTSVDANGVRTETRVFHDNRRVAKVVVVTRDGKRTTTVYAPNGESKDLKDNVVDGLQATGNAIADGAGWVAEKTVDVADKTKEGAKTVGEKTAEGAKTVAEKTAAGAKKTGKAIKKALTP